MNKTSAFILLALLCATANAQSFENAGASGAQFLKIGVGARAMGMGGAYASVTGDVASLAWNPAGIGTIEQFSISAQHTPWVAETDHNFIGLVVPVNEQFALGFHTIFLTTDKVEITTIDLPEGTGQFYDASDLAVGLTSSVRLTTQLTFAMTIKHVEERIYDLKSGGLAIDAGASYDTGFRSLAIGFSISHLGLDQTFSGKSLEVHYDPGTPGEPQTSAELQTLAFSLPLLFRASGSFDVFRMVDEAIPNHKLLFAFDFIQESDSQERVAIGAEYGLYDAVAFRTGYLLNADELSWSAGGGARISMDDFDVSFDYAASSLGRFGLAHRIGLNVVVK